MSFSKLVQLSPGAVTTAAPWTSDEIVIREPGGDNDYRRAKVDGFFSLDITLTGSGTLAATVTCSNGSSFVAHEGAAAIISGKAAGHYLASFSVPVCRAFKVTLTATTATCTVSECIVAMA